MCKQIRALRADEVETRAQKIFEYANGGSGVQLLLYKNARADMNILDEVFGPDHWQRIHYDCKGNLYCKVGIYYDEMKEWVWKSDCGAESDTEAEKGEASDAFKRACTNVGIGRELYTSPKIFVDGAKAGVKKNAKGKLVCDDFDVSLLEVIDKKIAKLEIKNAKTGEVVFRWAANKPAPAPAPKAQEAPKAPANADLPFPEAGTTAKLTDAERIRNMRKSLIDNAKNKAAARGVAISDTDIAKVSAAVFRNPDPYALDNDDFATLIARMNKE